MMLGSQQQCCKHPRLAAEASTSPRCPVTNGLPQRLRHTSLLERRTLPQPGRRSLARIYAKGDDQDASSSSSSRQSERARASLDGQSKIARTANDSMQSTSAATMGGADADESQLVEASRVIEENQAMLDAEFEEMVPQVSDSEWKLANLIYSSLGTAYLLSGIGMAVVACTAPGMLLPPGGSLALGGTLLGCTAVAAVRAASLFFYLKLSSGMGDQSTMRHQRINGLLALFGAAAFISQVVAALSASPLLSCWVLVLSGTTTAGCAKIAWDTSRHGPFVQWLFRPWDLKGTLEGMLAYLVRDLSTVAGITCLLLLALGATGSCGVVVDPGSWLGAVPGYWQLGGAEAGLRRLAGLGMLLVAVQAHALLEFATHIQTLPFVAGLKGTVVRSLAAQSRVDEVLRPSPNRFAHINVGMLLATALQAYFVFNAPSLGLDVNTDAALWGPLFLSTFVSLGYCLVCLFYVDWHAVGSAASGVWNFFAGIVAFVTFTFVMREEWASDHRL